MAFQSSAAQPFMHLGFSLWLSRRSSGILPRMQFRVAPAFALAFALALASVFAPLDDQDERGSGRLALTCPC